MSKTPLDMRETWNKVGMTEIEIWNNASQNDRDKMAERATIERCAQAARESIIKNWGICLVPSALADVVDADIRALALKEKK